ncbi:MAG TPA: FHA domain-containing protein, partial [Pyrinomonadaceae bacterium]|nr:FHA domain-containing protein [Pyrinomonadaceae bacterium]
MPTAELIVSQPGRRTRRVETSLKLISIGRKDDNTVALPGDQSVSRYHAVIKQQPDGFWLIHLSESSSTLVNDQPVQTTRRLAHGDLICVGGSSTIEFLTRGAGSGDDADDGAAATPPHAPSPNAPPPSAPAADLPTAPAPPVPATPAPASGGFPVGTLVGVVGGLAVVALVAVLLVSFLRPDSGDAASSSDARPSRSSSSNADSGTRADSGADARANDSDAPTPEPPP